jgi:hypothetical protein
VIAFGGALRGEVAGLRSALHVWCCARGRIHIYEGVFATRRLPTLLALALPFRASWRRRASWVPAEM